MCPFGHSLASAATTGMGTMAATEGGDADSCICATNVEKQISIPVAIATVLHPRHSALGVSHPLPDTVHNKFVNILRFRELLTGHPDQDLVSSIITGFQIGFDIGFRGTLTNTRHKNNKSADTHKEGLAQSIKKEVTRGHTAGPFPAPPFPITHISPLGAVPKPDGSIRLIMDLSQPKGKSINDFISKEAFPCKYTPFDEATRLVRKAGRGCFLSKIDIKHAYRLLPVRPEDWPLLVYCWQGQYYVDLKLPFGCRSSASIFTDFADLVCWIINQKYDLVVIHYSDDYLLISPALLELATQQNKTLLAIFRYLDIPVAEDKLLGPTTKLPFLGIDIDTEQMTISVPTPKLQAILALLPKWHGRRTATKQELLAFIGKLHHISIVVRPGRLFLRRLIDLSCTVKQLHHHVNLNRETRRDIQWWTEWLPTWNSASFIPQSRSISTLDLRLHTDASGKGLGAIYGREWIQSRWDSYCSGKDVDFQELFAIFAAASTWGHQWAGQRIVFMTDNLPITQIWDKGTTPTPHIMEIVRRLFLLAVQCNFSVAFKYIPGILNPIADALSRFQEERFRILMPDAATHPTQIPPQVWKHTHQQ